MYMQFLDPQGMYMSIRLNQGGERQSARTLAILGTVTALTGNCLSNYAIQVPTVEK